MMMMPLRHLFQWLVEHRELEADARDIAVALRDRSDAEADGEDVTRINTRIRMRLNAMTESIARLRSEVTGGGWAGIGL